MYKSVPYGEHHCSRVPSRQRISKGLFYEAGGQRVVCQLHKRGATSFERPEGPAVQNPPPRLPAFNVGHLPELLVRERVGGAVVQ